MSVTDKSSFVYLLVSNTGSTYVGATIDLDRRLRQHNGEIKGGAKITSRRESWTRHCHVAGFPSWQAALQFEWRWKQLTRKVPQQPRKLPVERRLCALTDLLALERSTSKAMAYSEWESFPVVVFR